MGFVVGEDFGVVLGELGYLCKGCFAVLPHEEIAVVGEWRKEGWVFGIDLIAKACELKFSDYSFLEEAG